MKVHFDSTESAPKYATILQIVKKPNVQKDIQKSVRDSMKMVNVFTKKNVPTFMMM